jgi:type IV pilus assembly protein PilF
MKNSELIVCAAICLLLLSGCVSTTTGTASTEPDQADAADLNFQLGARYFQNGNYELARDRLLLSIELGPKNGAAYSMLGRTYEVLDNPRLAREYYEQSIRVDPKSFEIQNAYAVFACNQREFDKAEKHFDKASSHPENDNAEVTLTNAGICMLQKPDHEAAEAFFRKALDRKTNFADALLQLCLLKYQQEDYLASRAFLQRFMAANKTTAGVLLLGAQIEQKLGNQRARSEYVNQLLRDFPTSPEARKALESG